MSMSEPGGASADWLQLRSAADTRARDHGSAGLLERLVEHLRQRGAEKLRMIDVGAGTGANRAYLEPRLPFDQVWVAVDHDPVLLDHDDHGESDRIEAGVKDLIHVLERCDDHGSVVTVMTCTALLDVLTTRELGCFADAVEAFQTPALLAMSVTGAVTWAPADDADVLLSGAFNAHQQRNGRAGGAAVSVLRTDLSARGLDLMTAQTPWVLDARNPDVFGRWLDERVKAAVQQRPEDAPELGRWARRRAAQLRAGDLVARVGHEDLLILPA
ncbi:MAG TPA: hypothetical protein VK045_05385 [Ornithinicoccus sp.]|nr:hypothetical protein [Ornithinicoccus sp.]